MIELELEFFGDNKNNYKDDYALVDVEVGFNISKGYPATGPSYSCGGEPGCPDEIEDIEIIVQNTFSFMDRIITKNTELPEWIKQYIEIEDGIYSNKIFDEFIENEIWEYIGN